MKRLLPALLLSAAAHTFAADAPRAVPAQAPAGFPFAVETQILSENTYQVKITDRKTGKAQTIEDIVIFPGYIQGNTGSPVDIRDYNGDGHPDIAVRVIGGYTLPADDLYLFNPATRQFKTPPDGQNIAIVGNVEVIRKGCIRVEYKSSIMDYDEEDYCWKNGGWEMLRLKNAKAHKKPKGK